MAAKRFSTFIAICIFLLSHTVYSEILNYDNTDCIVDDTLPADEEGNYVDCNTEEALRDNKTRCCDIEGSKGCCTNETNSDKMVIIGTTIGMVTASIGTACFIVFWCNADTLPCLKRCPCKCCHRGSDEFSEMQDLTPDIKKIGEANQQYLRDPDDDEYAPPEKYDMPDELREDVREDWWGAPPTMSATAF